MLYKWLLFPHNDSSFKLIVIFKQSLYFVRQLDLLEIVGYYEFYKVWKEWNELYLFPIFLSLKFWL